MNRRITAGILDYAGLSAIVYYVGDLTLKPLAGSTLLIVYLTDIALNVVYHGTMEFICGRSLGKIACGLTVVSLDGERPKVRQLIIRNLARIVDILPTAYVVAYVVVRSDPVRSQRLGDMLAGTTVRQVEPF